MVSELTSNSMNPGLWRVLGLQSLITKLLLNVFLAGVPWPLVKESVFPLLGIFQLDGTRQNHRAKPSVPPVTIPVGRKREKGTQAMGSLNWAERASPDRNVSPASLDLWPHTPRKMKLWWASREGKRQGWRNGGALGGSQFGITQNWTFGPIGGLRGPRARWHRG